MADKLTYKGGTNVVGSTGTMKLVLPRGGGDFHRVVKWWSKKGTVSYVEAAIFKVPLDNGESVRLILPGAVAHMTVEIRHNGAGEFTFPNSGNLERCIVVAADSFDIIYEYQFAKISGGSVLKRTVGTLPEPAPVSVSFSSQTELTGTATVGQTLTATAGTYTGGVGSVTTKLRFQASDTGSGNWAVLQNFNNVTPGESKTYTLQAGDDAKYIRASYQVTDDEGNTTSNAPTLGPVATTFAQDLAAADYTYTVTVVNTGTAESPVNVYALNGTNQQAVTMNAGETVAFDFSAVASAHPLGIFTDATKSTPVTAGVQTGGTGNATLLYTPSAAATVSYQCINHAGMGGDITVS